MALKPYLLFTLKELGTLGGLESKVELSSQELASRLGLSQQTASRYLLELDKQGLISRELGVRKQLIHIQAAGRAALEAELLDYQRIFTLSSQVIFSGTVVSGLGEGTYYTAQPGYRKQFETKLGFIPYPGTLNVQIDFLDRNKLRLLSGMGGITIDEFTSGNRTFGSVQCFPATVNGVQAAIVMPKRSHYATVLECISPYHLKGLLHLQDGDAVEVVVSIAKR